MKQRKANQEVQLLSEVALSICYFYCLSIAFFNSKRTTYTILHTGFYLKVLSHFALVAKNKIRSMVTQNPYLTKKKYKKLNKK